MSDERLLPFRRFYADLLTAPLKGPAAERLRDAFLAIPRERFLGPGPWRVLAGEGYVVTPSDDPALIYQDVVVALSAEQGINNGQPSLHALSLAALDPRPGDKVLHVGVGGGYYTAILDHLVRPEGSVQGFEIDPSLSRRAADLLLDRPNVAIHHRSGTTGPLPPSDVIYVNAGATPDEGWGGSLARWAAARRPSSLPADGMLLVKAGPRGFEAEIVTSAMFIGCQGLREAEAERRTRQAFARGDTEKVRSLRRGTRPDGSCWLAWESCWLSTAPLTAG